MFIAALVVIDKTWKQPKRIWMDDWIKRMVCTYRQPNTTQA